MYGAVHTLQPFLLYMFKIAFNCIVFLIRKASSSVTNRLQTKHAEAGALISLGCYRYNPKERAVSKSFFYQSLYSSSHQRANLMANLDSACWKNSPEQIFGAIGATSGVWQHFAILAWWHEQVIFNSSSIKLYIEILNFWNLFSFIFTLFRKNFHALSSLAYLINIL